MFFTFDFGSVGAVSAVTYRFADASGAWLAVAQTDAVNIGAIPGLYGVEVTPPTGSKVIYWACSDATLYGHENIASTLALDAIPTAAAIADAVLDEDVSTGDTSDTTLRGIFAEATSETPVVAPAPPSDASLCTVYVYTETIANAKTSGLKIRFRLHERPAKSERVLEIAPKEMTTDADGFASMALQRTDALTPTGSYYVVTCAELGLNHSLYLAADTYNLADLIV